MLRRRGAPLLRRRWALPWLLLGAALTTSSWWATTRAPTSAARGLRVPQDVSIVGHNDMPLVDMVEPPLTTIRISHVAMGEEAARLLVREIETPGLSPERIVTPPELVVRGSTMSPSLRGA